MAAESGLLAWSNAIRFTMVNDPGRQVFQDQVNKHGFIFLDDYLNNILSGAKQHDPMIELVKTPARKQPTHKTRQSARGALSRIYPIATGDDAERKNPPLLNSFNQAIVKTKEPSVVPTTSGTESNDTGANIPVPSSVVLPSQAEPVLSIIEEDEESPERDPTVFHTPSSGHLAAQGSSTSDARVDMLPLHLIPQDEEKSPRQPTSPTSPQSAPRPIRPERVPEESTTVTTRSFSEVQSSTETHPQPPGKGEEDLNEGILPSLPGPLALRKSTRFPQEIAPQNGPLGAPTPGAPPGGKRTSWLKKAREVKAMESLARVGSSSSSLGNSNPLKRKSDESSASSGTAEGDMQGRHRKSLKVSDEQSVLPEPQAIHPGHSGGHPEVTLPHFPAADIASAGHEGMLDRLKRTVEGLGARVGKSFGNALGTNPAVTALAEARAAAEARVAQRNSEDEQKEIRQLESPPVSQTIRLVNTTTLASAPDTEGKRLSVSDLFPPRDTSFKVKGQSGSKSPSSKLQPLQPDKLHEGVAKQASNSPLFSPTSSRQLPIPPIGVFDRPQPVFVPPMPSSPVGPRAKNGFTPKNLAHKGNSPGPVVFGPTSMISSKPDAGQTRGEAPHWLSGPSHGAFMSFNRDIKSAAQQFDDDDDSWPIDEKLPPGVQWNFSVKDDSLTWSTMRTESQRGDTGTWRTAEVIVEESHQPHPPRTGVVDPSGQNDEEDSGSEMDVVDLTEDVTTASNPEDCEIPRSTSQLSMASSQTSFTSTTSKSAIHAPGTAKKGKAEVKKVLQMAAVAAKKQQEENDKKAARLKDMEARRQAAQQKKLDEEKQKALEQDRKLKEEGERRKRDREENTDKRSLKAIVKKDDDTMKKRKIVPADGEKKELKKVSSKSILKPSLKQPTVPSSSSTATGSKPVEIKPPKSNTAWKGKAKAVPKMPTTLDDDISQPSQIMQTQMAARVETRIQAAKAPERVQSESIELPDINSEYSDSEDEDRKRTYDPPNWAQSPELREALRLQSTINPDDIFGSVKPLKMEEIFKSRTSRFRARTSSANWAGTDGLTPEEEREYAKRMGFR